MPSLSKPTLSLAQIAKLNEQVERRIKSRYRAVLLFIGVVICTIVLATLASCTKHYPHGYSVIDLQSNITYSIDLPDNYKLGDTITAPWGIYVDLYGNSFQDWRQRPAVVVYKYY